MGHTSSWHKGSAKPRYLGTTHGMLQQRGCEESYFARTFQHRHKQENGSRCRLWDLVVVSSLSGIAGKCQGLRVLWIIRRRAKYDRNSISRAGRSQPASQPPRGSNVNSKRTELDVFNAHIIWEPWTFASSVLMEQPSNVSHSQPAGDDVWRDPYVVEGGLSVFHPVIKRAALDDDDDGDGFNVKPSTRFIHEWFMHTRYI